jgi:hypothetical protein
MRMMTNRICRGLCGLLAFVVLAPVAQAQPATPDATPASASAPLDVAAMALTPVDLETLGLAGYLVADGRTQTLEDRAAEQAEDQDNLAEVTTFLTGLGWVRGYRARLAHPISDGEEDFDALISSGVTQFKDASGAQTAFDLNSDIDVREGNATPVSDTTTVGDRSKVLHLGEVTLDDGIARQALRLFFQHEALLADIVVFSMPDQPMETDDIQALATRLLERIEAVLAGSAPDLSVKVLRWQGVGLADPDLDNYLVLDGEAYEALGDTAEERADDTAQYQDATDRYVYEAALTDTLFQSTTVVRFSSEDVAGDWVQGAFDRAEEDRDAETELAVVRDAPAFGDESVVLRYTTPAGDQEVVVYGVIVRVGEVAIGVGVASLSALDAAGVWAMVEAQLACFDAGDCTDSAPLPAGVAG